MKRLYLFCYYYFYALREPVHDTNIRSVAMKLLGSNER